ncbi:MAG: ribonuclease III [Pseudobdellovibrionaceae bacterium]|jgi:ribonuclease-3|nr:ribonuclease III [Pseudobdellovibrionaceae bacterium]
MTVEIDKDEEAGLKLKVFQDRLGYHFRDRDLLINALTHASTGEDKNYERMEFLGDRVLGLVIAEILYRCFPYENEGALARRHSALACTQTLAKIALDLEVHEILRATVSDKSSGNNKQENILADCMEAIIGAIFLDFGYVPCQEVITSLWGDKIYTLMQPPIDSKTALQEWAQARKLAIPNYEVISREGPDHAPVFTVRVTVDGYDSETAIGNSKRNAEKVAAQALYDKLKKHSG